jgi:hypothetical protein
MAVLYITSTRLMRLSEEAVREHASSGEEIPRRACTQLLANEPRYSEWHVRHESRMRMVADERRRARQILDLRALAVEQAHRTAVVDYLRLGRVTGGERERTLALFHGVSDARDAALAEHRTYLLAASTRVCTLDLLDLVGDRDGLELVHQYELAYRQYFAMFCDRALALQAGGTYLLSSLLPEVKDVADRLRLKIVGTHPRAREPRRAAGGAGQTVSLARTLVQARAPQGLGRAGPLSVTLRATPSARTRTER